LCSGRPYLSLTVGLVCIALGWPRLRRQNWWWRLDNLAGQCQWEWWRSLRSPAGRAMPCINLLPLPPPRGRHWPVGGFQQCGVCVLSSCCGLSVVRLFFVLRAGLLVSFPEGMVSCKLGSALVLHPSDFCGVKYLLQCLRCCMGRRIPWRRLCRSVVDHADV